VSFYGWETGCIYKYSVYSSVDSISWLPAAENIWSENLEWNEIEFDSIDAKYVKLVLLESNQSPRGSIWEFEIFGPDAANNSDVEPEIPAGFSLSQNYPNPFNPSTKINVNLPKASHIRLVVYNILGEQVSELANGEFVEGLHEFNFDAEGFASGIYIYRIESAEFVETKKMMLIR